MEQFRSSEFVKRMAAGYLARQKVRPGDWKDGDGLLHCGTCGEPRQTVRILADPSPGNPGAQSKLVVPVMCRCEKEAYLKEQAEEKAAEDRARLAELRSASLMDDRFSSARFEAFRTTAENARVLKLCRRYADRFDEMAEKGQGLVFWGPAGTGKSFAAACIANALLDRGVPVIMTSFVKLLAALQDGGSGGEQGIVSRLNRAKLAVFDDLGAERSTDYALEKVYSIVDGRYRKKLPMILTTNLTLDSMRTERDTRYVRIYDRIFESCYAVQFEGPSWRRRESARRYEEMHRLLEG